MYSTSSRASASGVVVGRMPVSKSPDHSANHKKKEQKSLCKVLIYLIYINSYKSGLWELMTHYASLVGIGAEVGTFNFTTKLNHKSGAASTASVIGRCSTNHMEVTLCICTEQAQSASSTSTSSCASASTFSRKCNSKYMQDMSLYGGMHDLSALRV